MALHFEYSGIESFNLHNHERQLSFPGRGSSQTYGSRTKLTKKAFRISGFPARAQTFCQLESIRRYMTGTTFSGARKPQWTKPGLLCISGKRPASTQVRDKC